MDNILCLKPMAPEQVLADRDSEDEVDDDVADFEDRRVCSVIFFLTFFSRVCLKNNISGCTTH